MADTVAIMCPKCGTILGTHIDYHGRNYATCSGCRYFGPWEDEARRLASELATANDRAAAYLRFMLWPHPAGGYVVRLPWRHEGYGGAATGFGAGAYYFGRREDAVAAIDEAAGLTGQPAAGPAVVGGENAGGTDEP